MRVREPWLLTLLLAVILVAGTAKPGLSQDACFQDFHACATLTGPAGFRLEPSGLAWLPDLGLLVGVLDDTGPWPEFALFYVLESDLSAREIPVHPLLTREQAQAFQVQDLEGLTAVEGTHTLFAVGSLSLDKHATGEEDSWRRHHLLRLEVVARGEGTYGAEKVALVSANRRPDFREWVISSSGRPWLPEVVQGRPESGGINVEGLASDAQGNLLVGFRGPVSSGMAPVLRLDPEGPHDQPKALGWLELDVSGLPVTQGESMDRGIRGFDRIPGSGEEELVVLVGHTGPRYDNLRVIRWNASRGTITDLAELPEEFVGEGIAVMERTATEMKVAMVSDKGAKIMIRVFPLGMAEATPFVTAGLLRQHTRR